jgi:uncharacterized protein (TIGR02001 family)
MKKLLGLAALAGAAAISVGAAPTASAEATFSGNVALTSDYVFRGISQSDSDVAISGGFDYGNGFNGLPVYAGVWASSIDFGLDGTVEVDLYGGVKPQLGPITLDAGFVYYIYPGIDDSFDADYLELKLGGSVSPAEGFTIGAVAYYAPEFTFTDDESGLYVEANAAYAINELFAVSGAIGNQSVDLDNYYGAAGDSYTTFNVGGTLSAYGFGIDLRYYDTDIDPDLVGPSGDEISDGRVVLTFKRAL